MFKGGEEARVGYPTEGMGDDVAGRSFHHGRFVMKLRQAAKSVPSVTVRQGTVKRLVNGECAATPPLLQTNDRQLDSPLPPSLSPSHPTAGPSPPHPTPRPCRPGRRLGGGAGDHRGPLQGSGWAGGGGGGTPHRCVRRHVLHPAHQAVGAGHPAALLLCGGAAQGAVWSGPCGVGGVGASAVLPTDSCLPRASVWACMATLLRTQHPPSRPLPCRRRRV